MKQNNKKWFILLGKQNQDHFDLNIGIEKQKEIVNQLYKMKWDKKHHNQEVTKSKPSF